MKTNYLSAIALVGLLAFSSCSKDDASTDNKTTTTEEKSTIVLSPEQTVAASNGIAQNLNQIGQFDQLLSTSTLLKGMATTGPEICGQKPEGKLNPTTASYDFVYDFGTSGDCTFSGANIKGKLTISVDAKKNITLLFNDFYRKDTQVNEILETTYNGTMKAPVSNIANQKSYTADLTTTTKITKINDAKFMNSLPRINFSLSSMYRTKFRWEVVLTGVSKTQNLSFNNNKYSVSFIDEIESKGLNTESGIANLTVTSTDLVYDKACKQQLVAGSLQINDATLPKNNTTITFGDCASKKWTIRNDGKDYFITF